MNGKIHEGRNVKWIRDLLGMKQEAFADALGFNQQKLSLLEQKEEIDIHLLERIAIVLGTSVDLIKNFNEANVLKVIGRNPNENLFSSTVHLQCSFNPFDKIVELYEALLRSEKEKLEILKTTCNITAIDSLN